MTHTLLRALGRNLVLACFAALIVALLAAPAYADAIADYYKIEDIDTPEGLDARVGGMEVLDDGRLAIVFMRGEVYLYDPEQEHWHLFATGLHDPLGLHVVDESEMLIGQKPEITRLRDTTGDGRADTFETVSDDFGLSGERGEFLFGPVKDAQGHLYFNLMTNSRDDVSEIPRGTFTGHLPGDRGSVVPYRGWVMKVDAQSGETIPYASGIRSPNGIGIDPEGRLIVVDNEGEWFGSNYVFHIEPSNFYGHPTSLTWAEDWDWREDGFPDQELSRDELDAKRTLPIVEIPHGSHMAHSPSFPYWDLTGGAFGPFERQMFVGEVNNPRILRIMLEEVAGELQGAVTTFYEHDGLRIGSNRMAFDADRNALWVGHADRSWGGGQGIQRITWTGSTPMDVLAMNLTEAGFDVTFTHPVDPQAASDPDAYAFRRYYYEYSQSYGSDELGEAPVNVESVSLSEDGRTVSLVLEELEPGYIHEMQMDGIASRDGLPVINTTVSYTLNRLLDGTTGRP